MRIEFVCRSDPHDDARAAQAKLEELARHSVSGMVGPLGPGGPTFTVADETVVEVRIVFDPSRVSPDQTAPFVARCLEWLEESSRRSSLNWNVEHELDAELGRVEAGVASDLLADEILTAIRVAESLQGVIVDDEFVDFDLQGPGGAEGAHDEAAPSGGRARRKGPALDGTHHTDSWDDLLSTEESFIRFPELE